MCGVVGIATCEGARPSVGSEGVARLRDRMSHRGPDAAGLWDGGHVILGHRRLAVIAPGPEGAQPMHAGAATLVYNGELYNDAEVRAAMRGEGAQLGVAGVMGVSGGSGVAGAAGVRAVHGTRGEFADHDAHGVPGSDTRTVLSWLEAADDPVAALSRLRGMFALAYVDVRRGRLVLARDCLGIKPLYYTVRRCGERAEVIFASEAAVVAGAPGGSVRPDWGTVSSYLTTIRTTMGERTMFEGVKTLLPGEVLTFDLRDAGLRMTRARLGVGPRGDAVCSAAEVAEVVRDSVRRHLRSDVPVCCLLSGGLDSTIITGLCVSEGVVPRTYAAGALGADGERVGDLAYAWRTARAMGTDHAEAVVDREMFVSRVREMIDRTGMVISTPNEIAINEVARRLRRDGCVVALSGEGADELFGGYEWPMRAAAEFVERVPRATAEEAAAHHIGEGAWIEPGRKGLVLRESMLKKADGDEGLRTWYAGEMASAMEESGGEAMQAHLSFMRRVNLTGLLMRLDSATMLEGVEGRTPFADGTLAAAAMGLPMSMKYERAGGRGRTKIVLREGFAGVVPGEVLTREKASFPLPFQEWCGGLVEGALEGAWAREVFEEVAVEAVKRVPAEAWRLAWPMLNLGLWGQKWWG